MLNKMQIIFFKDLNIVGIKVLLYTVFFNTPASSFLEVNGVFLILFDVVKKSLDIY